MRSYTTGVPHRWRKWRDYQINCTKVSLQHKSVPTTLECSWCISDLSARLAGECVVDMSCTVILMLYRTVLTVLIFIKKAPWRGLRGCQTNYCDYVLECSCFIISCIGLYAVGYGVSENKPGSVHVILDCFWKIPQCLSGIKNQNVRLTGKCSLNAE